MTAVSHIGICHFGETLDAFLNGYRTIGQLLAWPAGWCLPVACDLRRGFG